MINIGLLGFGTVGSGVYELITNYKALKNHTDEEVVISKILIKDLSKKRNSKVPKELFTDNFREVVDNPQIDIIIEAISGFNPAYTFLVESLERGKHVVTANKAVVAKHLKSLLVLAEKNHKGFFFEASVGGGIPIIKPLKHHSAFNEMKEVKGILNGTSNFILTQMNDNDLTFEGALTLAQQLGYAETDPSDDIKGYDVRRKLAILSSIAFKKQVSEEMITCRGIDYVTSFDMSIFKTMDCTVKLLGKAINSNNRVSASVEPVLMKNDSSLSKIKNACNLISVTGNIVGELQFVGEGAGKNPTANAIICDVIDILGESYKHDNLLSKKLDSTVTIQHVASKYYVRLSPYNYNYKVTLVKALEEKSWIKKVLSYDKNIILFTEKLSLIELEENIQCLKFMYKSSCYVRLEEDIEIKA